MVFIDCSHYIWTKEQYSGSMPKIKNMMEDEKNEQAVSANGVIDHYESEELLLPGDFYAVLMEAHNALNDQSTTTTEPPTTGTTLFIRENRVITGEELVENTVYKVVDTNSTSYSSKCQTNLLRNTSEGSMFCCKPSQTNASATQNEYYQNLFLRVPKTFQNNSEWPTNFEWRPPLTQQPFEEITYNPSKTYRPVAPQSFKLHCRFPPNLQQYQREPFNTYEDINQTTMHIQEPTERANVNSTMSQNESLSQQSIYGFDQQRFAYISGEPISVPARGSLEYQTNFSHTDMYNMPQSQNIVNESTKPIVEECVHTHIGEKLFQCDVSKNKFILERDHQTEKGFQCNICQKKLSSKKTLRTHARIHTGQKPFQCNICQKKLSSKDACQIHVRIHTGEKPFQCNICQKKLSSKQALRIHIIKTHTGEKQFQCNICQRKLSSEDALQTHVRIHTGEKPFQCNICQKKLSSKNALRVHSRIHTGKKQFQCNNMSNVNYSENFFGSTHLYSGTEYNEPFQYVMSGSILGLKKILIKHIH